MLMLTAIVLSSLASSSQIIIKGQILDKETSSPVSFATIKTAAGHYALSAENGQFAIHTIEKGSITITVSVLGYKTSNFNFNNEAFLTLYLEKNIQLMQPVEIRALRASDKAPFAKTTMTATAIDKMNVGQDLPFIVNQTPSVVINSDAGNGIGYTGIRIRGTDATRINMTINGIPYNDAESQGIFFVNLPDLASSLNSIQIQRGVGTSSNGAGAFGATLNLSTNEINEKSYAELNNSFGSFNTWKNTVKVGTGLLNDHFTFDARLSRISSDGYIDRARSDLQSFYFSGAYLSKNGSLRMNVFSGKEKTYQAWYGVSEDMLASNRRFNAAGTERAEGPYQNETDNYKQTHYQLFYNQNLSSTWKMNIATFLTKGLGYYEQYKADINAIDYNIIPIIDPQNAIRPLNIIRQLWLDNDFYGNTFSLQHKKNRTDFILGGGWNRYDGRHNGDVIWASYAFPDNYRWYALTAKKSDQNIYAKWQEEISKNLTLFTDLQFRNVIYTINGFRNNPGLMIDKKWIFFNPKIGLNYSVGKTNAFISFAVANKEPNREDFEAGTQQQPKHETLYDWEAGIERRDPVFNWSVTLFNMQYKNQLVLTGMINDVGAYTRTNIPSSFRRGIEITGSWKPLQWLDAGGNISFSSNKVKNFTAYYDNYDNGTQETEFIKSGNIALSPAVVGGYTVNIRPVQKLSITLSGKYVSRQYLDNTSKKERSLDPFFQQDLRVAYVFQPKFLKSLEISGNVNNLFNNLFEPNGYTFSYFYSNNFYTENYFYPMAGIHFFLSVKASF